MIRPGRMPLRILLFFAAFIICAAQAHAADVRLEGTVKLFSSFYTTDSAEDAFRPHDAGDYSLNRGELHLGLNGYVSDNVSFRSKVYFIYDARPEYDDLQELESESGYSSIVHEQDTYIKEASFTLMDLLLEGLDLKVGRQRVRWGTSDEYNVVDNLNPVDYRNLYSFDPDYLVEHLNMDGFDLEYLLPVDFELKLQAAYFVSFKPSTLPLGFNEQSLAMQQARADELTSSYGFSRADVDMVVRDVPDYRVSGGPVGIRLSGVAFNFDWGLSYYHGYQSLPMLYRIQTDVGLDATSVTSFYDYPRLDVVGFDLAGEVHSIGVWAEFGAYFPEEKDVVVVTNLISSSNGEVFPLLEDIYYKYTVGFDYTFGIGNGIYWNTQFNHGYYDEFDYTPEAEGSLGVGNAGFMGKLEDYYITSIEYSFFNDELTTTLNFMLEVSDYEDFSDNTALVIKPEIEYKPFDNTSLEIGYVAISGGDQTKYGGYEDNDVVYLLMKTYF
ncbi:MAG TPA: hypothetical protein PLU81_16665 [Deltaproteobacteria bacterium]|nr:hypothetical protein [Deltaproteobacteria bacterium]